jgi:coenzyme F420-0:L-glutamate ligase/coenzyme F420-1:gamma-L-glutamate ligase
MISIRPVDGIGEVSEGDDLGAMIASAAQPGDADVLVVSQKVVSKAEGRTADLAAVNPGERALELAAELDRDPRLVELILRESPEVIRAERGVLIVALPNGIVCANAGIDRSNAGPGDDRVVLLPIDPDASARRIRAQVQAASGARPGVVVADSFGRPWRLGQTDVAIGCAGIVVLDDWRGRADRDGRTLAATAIARADELAAAASLAREKDSGHPAAVISGLAQLVSEEDGPGIGALVRPAADDLFR